jgi:hypothetical protein
MFLRVKHGRSVGLTTSPPTVISISTKCGILYFLQPYGSPRPVKRIALLARMDGNDDGGVFFLVCYPSFTTHRRITSWKSFGKKLYWPEALCQLRKTKNDFSHDTLCPE